MKLRLVVMAVFLVGAGCGITAVATREDPATADGGRDATAGPADADPQAAPAGGSSEVPIGDLDAGEDAASTTELPRFEIIPPAGGKFTILAPGAAKPCSVASGQGATFAVKNFTAEKVRVRWVDYVCVEHDYGTVNPTKAKSQPTFVTHRWRIRSDVDAGILGDFVLDAPGTYQVIVR
ncbi:MAG TPA: hypothetical protein VLT33_31235 [Labilithrix sp.]|nr:hypothetical protein [Labilithrix sp.]